MQPRRILVAVVLVVATIASILWDRHQASATHAADPRPAAQQSPATEPPVAEPASAAAAAAIEPRNDLSSLIPSDSERTAVLATLAAIADCGPYPHDRDGIVFRNRERLLPIRQQRYYREFTVRTPGRRDRGPRRLVVGRDGEVYYTRDHYASFVRIDQVLEPDVAAPSRRPQ